MMSAPSVNQMRFLRSSALPSAAKLKLAASCSAADAIRSPRAYALGPMWGGARTTASLLGDRCWFGRLQQLDRPPSCLDRGDRAFGSVMHFECKPGFELALAQQAHSGQRLADQP